MVESNLNINQEEIIEASLKVVDYFFTKRDGMVIIYQVIPGPFVVNIYYI